MRNPSQIAAWRTYRLLRFACLAFLVVARPSHGSSSGRCLTPEVGRALSDLVAAGALQRALGSDFRLTRGDVGGNRIELEIQDQAHHSYDLVLAIPESRKDAPDGAGRRFAYYLGASPPSPHPAATTALLAVAGIVDETVPETALQPCSQPGSGSPPEAPPAADSAPEAATGSTPPDIPPASAPRRVPRDFALAGALAQLAVLAGAILFGVHVVGSMPPPATPQSDEDGGE